MYNISLPFLTLLADCIFCSWSWFPLPLNNRVNFISKFYFIFSCRSIWRKYFGINYSNTVNILTTLWILMAWCFSTRASVATVLNRYPCKGKAPVLSWCFLLLTSAAPQSSIQYDLESEKKCETLYVSIPLYQSLCTYVPVIFGTCFVCTAVFVFSL